MLNSIINKKSCQIRRGTAMRFPFLYTKVCNYM